MNNLVLLRDPLTNRGTGFTDEDRACFHLEGLLPPRVETIEDQAARVVDNIREKASALEKYRYLSALQAENETLFYRVVLMHLEELLPIIYTPTVGQACVEWSRIYERPRGLYLSAARHRGRIESVLRNWAGMPQIIVVTDGGRILGLGDLGANGMGIPIGKLGLYTACAGLAPAICLPVTLDVGTDNAVLRADPQYLGERQPRVAGAAYDAFLAEFVAATQAVFPGAILQFEDFNNASAFGLLAQYRHHLCCFNDDIQGTGAMGLAGLYSAGRLTGRSLPEERILFLGAGEACLGIGAAVMAALRSAGLSDAAARERLLFIDSKGPVVATRPDLPAHKRPFALDRPAPADLLAAIKTFEPTVLIGASAQAGAFSEPVLRGLSDVTTRPVVFALSNPTSKSECTAEQAYRWTDGRAVFASGSPFGRVTAGGQTHTPGQANNSFIFPGVGLGLLLSGAQLVTDEMFSAAARALADQVSTEELSQGRIFPAASRMRVIAAAVAAAVAGVAHAQGVATRPRPADLADAAARAMWVPDYAG